MKILYHHRTKAADGQLVHITELTAALTALGHEVIMVGPDGAANRKMDAGSGSRAGLRNRLPGWLYELLELGYAMLALWRLLLAWWQHRPDALYERYNLFCPAGVWLKKLTGLPMALEVNAPLFAERRDHGGLSLGWLAQWSERVTWRNADISLPVTGVLADAMVAEGVPRERIAVIPNGVGGAFWDGSIDGTAIRRTYGLEGKLVLGFTGFVRPWHGMDRAVRLLASGDLPDNAHLLVVGDGPALPDLRVLAEQLGVGGQVTFTGVKQRAEMPALVAAFDIALQPYAVGYASPLKLFEYLGMGCPVVAPRQPNICEVLTDGEDAILFDPADENSFGRAIVRLATDDGLRAAIGKAGRKTLETRNLSWHRNAERVAALLGEVCARTNRRRTPPSPAPIPADGTIRSPE